MNTSRAKSWSGSAPPERPRCAHVLGRRQHGSHSAVPAASRTRRCGSPATRPSGLLDRPCAARCPPTRPCCTRWPSSTRTGSARPALSSCGRARASRSWRSRSARWLPRPAVDPERETDPQPGRAGGKRPARPRPLSQEERQRPAPHEYGDPARPARHRRPRRLACTGVPTGHAAGPRPGPCRNRRPPHEQGVDLLTRDQARMLDAFRLFSRLKVIGGAGSGKTWLAQARRLSADGQRVALMCYSRGLARWF